MSAEARGLAEAFPVSTMEDLVERFDAAFDALERGNLDDFTELLREQVHPRCTFHSGIGSVVGGGDYVGVEGIRDWFADVIDTTSERGWRNRSYETHGDRVLLYLADFDFTGAASGARVTTETGAIFEYENGQCVRITSFTSREEARRFAEARVA